MIQDYFQLQRQPFPSIPTPELYYPASSIEAARTSLVRLIDRHEGPGLVIGPVGTGKSLLCRLLAESFRHRCRVLTLPSGRLPSRRALLQVILFELGLPYRAMDEGELRLSLIGHVTNRDVCPQGILLLVDESEALNSALLDELRSLTNLSYDGRSCIRLVLFGAPRLEEKFTHPRLESFNQRLAGRFYLEPLSVDETAQYIEQTFADCGGTPQEVFTPESLRKIHHACSGIPRLVNQLTDHALMLAAIGDHDLVDSDCVEEAWADLQQLPMPFSRQSHEGTDTLPSDIVEFGQLDFEPEDEGAPTRTTPPDASAHAPQLIDDQMSVVDAVPPTEAVDRDRDEFDVDFDLPSGITLVFHSSNNPFGDDFAEEELIIDHFISPDALAQRHRRQVKSTSSKRLAEQMFQLRHQLAAKTHHAEGAADQPDSEPMANDTDSPLLATGQPTNTVVRDAGIRTDRLADPHESHPNIERDEALHDDDRGIISLGHRSSLVDSPRTTSEIVTPSDETAGATRVPSDPDSPRSYRNLFSQLRRRQG